MTRMRSVAPELLWFTSHSGVQVHPFAFTEAMVNLADVTHGLSHQGRFGGQAREWYSIAQHSILVAYLLHNVFGQPTLCWAGLMHDAPESLFGDVVSPIKRGLPDYRAAYNAAEAIMLPVLGVQYPLPEEVRQADLMALVIEARALMPPNAIQWIDELPKPPADIVLDGCLSPKEAKIAFTDAVMRYAPPALLGTRIRKGLDDDGR